MRIFAVYFSGTGNTKCAVETLFSEQDGTVQYGGIQGEARCEF